MCEHGAGTGYRHTRQRHQVFDGLRQQCECRLEQHLQFREDVWQQEQSDDARESASDVYDVDPGGQAAAAVPDGTSSCIDGEHAQDAEHHGHQAPQGQVRRGRSPATGRRRHSERCVLHVAHHPHPALAIEQADEHRLTCRRQAGHRQGTRCRGQDAAVIDIGRAGVGADLQLPVGHQNAVVGPLPGCVRTGEHAARYGGQDLRVRAARSDREHQPLEGRATLIDVQHTADQRAPLIHAKLLKEHVRSQIAGEGHRAVGGERESAQVGLWHPVAVDAAAADDRARRVDDQRLPRPCRHLGATAGVGEAIHVPGPCGVARDVVVAALLEPQLVVLNQGARHVAGRRPHDRRLARVHAQADGHLLRHPAARRHHLAIGREARAACPRRNRHAGRSAVEHLAEGDDARGIEVHPAAGPAR